MYLLQINKRARGQAKTKKNFRVCRDSNPRLLGEKYFYAFPLGRSRWHPASTFEPKLIQFSPFQTTLILGVLVSGAVSAFYREIPVVYLHRSPRSLLNSFPFNQRQHDHAHDHDHAHQEEHPGKEHCWEERGGIAQWLAFKLPYPAALGLIPGICEKIDFQRKIVNVEEVNWQPCCREQWTAEA